MGLFLNTSDVKKLRERVDVLETETRQLRLEWLSTYDKFRSILARIAKREERARDHGLEPDSSAGFQEAGVQPASSLPTIDPISARIHARRNRMRPTQ